MAIVIVALLSALGAAAQAQELTNPPPSSLPPAGARDPRAGPLPPSGPERGAVKRANPLPRGAILEEVSGTVLDVDRKSRSVTVETGGEKVTLSLDRNTMVYTPSGLGTVLDIVAGAQIRAGRNSDLLAYWIQVRAPGSKVEPPASTPGKESSPGGESAAGAPEAGKQGTDPTSPSTASPAGTAASAHH